MQQGTDIWTVSSPLSASVRAVDAQIRALTLSAYARNQDKSTYRNIKTCVTRQESHSTHEVLWSSHLTNGDKRSPLLLEIWVVVEDLLGATKCQQ